MGLTRARDGRAHLLGHPPRSRRRPPTKKNESLFVTLSAFSAHFHFTVQYAKSGYKQPRDCAWHRGWLGDLACAVYSNRIARDHLINFGSGTHCDCTMGPGKGGFIRNNNHFPFRARFALLGVAWASAAGRTLRGRMTRAPSAAELLSPKSNLITTTVSLSHPVPSPSVDSARQLSHRSPAATSSSVLGRDRTGSKAKRARGGRRGRKGRGGGVGHGDGGGNREQKCAGSRL